MQEEEKRESIQFPNIPEASKSALLAMEKEMTGLYLSGHPMDDYMDIARRANAPQLAQIEADVSGENAQPMWRDGMNVVLCAVISTVRIKTTKNNSLMAYVTAEDLTGSVELIVFSNVLQQAQGFVKEDEALKIVASGIYPLAEEYLEQVKAPSRSERKTRPSARQETAGQPAPVQTAPAHGQRLYLKVPSLNDTKMEQIRRLAVYYHGAVPMILVCEDTGKRMMAPKSMWVHKNLLFLDKLRFILGEKNVIMK